MIFIVSIIFNIWITIVLSVFSMLYSFYCLIPEKKKTKSDIYNISYYKNKYDEPGNKILLAVELDEFDSIVAMHWCCDRPDCNCEGGWRISNYSPNESVRLIK